MHTPGGWNPFSALSGMGRPTERFDLPTPNVRGFIDALLTVFEWTGFWLAVALPVVYLPLLYTGLSGTSDAVVFTVLLGLHVVSLLVGSDHATRDD